MQHRYDLSALREYDIRGIFGEALFEADAYATGRGFGSCVRRAGGNKVAVCRDARLSSPALEAELVRGLNDSGIDVVRIGVGPTPMLYYAEAELGVDGGIMITGSHNPKAYNGFKMVLQHRPFFGEQIRQLGVMAEAGDWERGSGTVSDDDIVDAYVDRLVRDFNFNMSGFRVGWDAGNGAAGAVIERLVQRLPGEHYTLYTEVDGNFPNHHPDPTVEANLADLKQLVLKEKLDFGLAFDGDGDRIGAVDAQGRMVWGDQLLAILSQPVLKDLPDAPIILDIKSSQAVVNRIAELGGRPLLWKTGHSLIKTKMKEVGSPLAGEMSGHIFFNHQWYGFDDAIFAAIRLISAVDELGASLADLRSKMGGFVNTPELRFEIDESRKFAVMDEILGRLQEEGADVNRIDGARVTSPDGWWLLRASNTQNVLVARAEARNEPGLERLLAQVDRHLLASGVSRTPALH